MLINRFNETEPAVFWYFSRLVAFEAAFFIYSVITAGVQTMASNTHQDIAQKTSTVTTISKTVATLRLETVSASATATETVLIVNTSYKLTTPSTTIATTRATALSPLLEGI